MCLTPGINGLAFIIEIIIAIWLFSLKKKKDTLVAAWLVLFLSLYQLSSFFICVYGVSFWNLFGYFIITWLPAMGLHLFSLQTKQKANIWFFYMLAAIFSIGIITTPFFAPKAKCEPLFVTYYDYPWGYLSYGVYYLGTIMLILFMAIANYKKTKNKLDRVKNIVFLFGMLSFIIPTYILMYTLPFLRASFASVFCFFAVFLAISLVFREKPELIADLFT